MLQKTTAKALHVICDVEKQNLYAGPFFFLPKSNKNYILYKLNKAYLQNIFNIVNRICIVT